MTTLTGWVRDQAELAGVLNSLHGLHLPILREENLTETNSGIEGQLDPAKSAPSEPEREDRTK